MKTLLAANTLYGVFILDNTNFYQNLVYSFDDFVGSLSSLPDDVTILCYADNKEYDMIKKEYGINLLV